VGWDALRLLAAAPALAWELDVTHRYGFEHRLTTRVDRVREPRAAEGARRAMNALWSIIGEIDSKRGPAARLC